MNAVIDVIVPAKPKHIKPFSIKNYWNNLKFEKIWEHRNYDNGQILVESLEVDHIIFYDQIIMVEESKELITKLQRIGFVFKDSYPNKKLFDKFLTVMYNEKHNVALSLYKTVNKNAIKTAYEIAQESSVDGISSVDVFLSSVKVLMSK